MNAITKGILAFAAVAAVAGCDPYKDENTGTPVVTSTIARARGMDPVLGTLAGGVWTIDKPLPRYGCTCTCGGTDAAPTCTYVDGDFAADRWPVVFVKSNKLLDGYSVQSTPDSCVPVGGTYAPPTINQGWLTAPAGPAECAGGAPSYWFACYLPNAPVPEEAGSVVLLRACQSPGLTAATAWREIALGTLGETFSLSGTVRDHQGHPLAFSVTVNMPTAADMNAQCRTHDCPAECTSATGVVPVCN